ncbi:hypothetical protein [Psychrobacillus sp. BL-248-WT-3]|uniref:hypothetical protein n=1 Tax=Psychrobacillus sp. BL-248-WT-3 TaxID=2725306 RepID=UPI00146D42DF|nr:hypothetical protein [Psychrobacillus sp. BL-248-WT-3]NME07808.1 hypothetical protein [Psychrobacillus sp. BL-248-WT-3]
MSEQLQLSVWLSKNKREQYIFIYKKLQEKFAATMETLFNDIEGSANKYKEKMVEEYGTAYNYDVVDPSDIFENIEMETYEFYKSEKLMEYNFHLSLLATTYQIFEQQLRGFIYTELNHRMSPIRTKDKFSKFGFNMGKIKEAYEYLNYDLTKTAQWETVELLADLVNTYKHGDGRSATRLYNKNPDLFLKGYFGDERLMDVELTTSAEIVFDIEKVGFDKYTNAIIEFWEGFPEYLTSVVEVD